MFNFWGFELTFSALYFKKIIQKIVFPMYFECSWVSRKIGCTTEVSAKNAGAPDACTTADLYLSCLSNIWSSTSPIQMPPAPLMASSDSTLNNPIII